MVEAEAAERIDNIVPSHGYQKLPVVGIGGSAGALQSLQAFLAAAPQSAGLAYVVVLHLSPEHQSHLHELVQKWTPMRVVQATNGETLVPDQVYVIPPGKKLLSADGYLRLTDIEREPGVRVAVDMFFRSLADSHGPHAIGVIMSGANSDGTLGIRRIKERGGLTIAQDPDEAEHAGMPNSAIDSGMVDWVLRAGEMPKRITEYLARERRLALPPEEGPHPTELSKPAAS